MSKYTTELRYICEVNSGLKESVGYSDIDTILERSWNKIFSFNFPIFKESYRKELCIKILRHFYTREISEETVGLWKLRLQSRMNEIMPYYNKLYEQWARDIDPLYNVDMHTKGGSEHQKDTTTDYDSKFTGKGNSKINGTSEHEKAYSDTPQGGISQVKNLSYLTNFTDVNNETKSTQDTTQNNTVNDTTIGSEDFTRNYIEEKYGIQGGKSYAELLNEFRQALINIDMMIIGDLENLFMLIW